MDVNLISQFIHHKIILFFQIKFCFCLSFTKKIKKALTVACRYFLRFISMPCELLDTYQGNTKGRNETRSRCKLHQSWNVLDRGVQCSNASPPQTHASSNLKNYFSNVSKLIILAVHFVKFYIFHDAFP